MTFHDVIEFGEEDRMRSHLDDARAGSAAQAGVPAAGVRAAAASEAVAPMPLAEMRWMNEMVMRFLIAEGMQVGCAAAAWRRVQVQAN
jgi:hypothetical protein